VVAEAAEELEFLLEDVPPEERAPVNFDSPWPWRFDPLSVAHMLVQTFRDDTETELERLIATWIGEDPENWPVVRLTVIIPWQDHPGEWHEDAPEWIRTFGTIAANAQARQSRLDRPQLL